MEAKPLVTYTGNCNLFKELEDVVCPIVSAEAVEWRRSLGRNRLVHIDAVWIPFDKHRLSSNRETLLNRQYLHTFWTDCSDSDDYKSTVKQDILSWMADLKVKSQWDWLIVVVEDNSRKTPAKTTSKLLKSTVWDRIRNDFPSKNIERVCTFVRPSRGESVRSASLDAFIAQFRTALLHALNREIGYYEDRLRENREARNSPGWSFIDFYFMQEQLAFVLETMTLYEDALVQYDELDALLTQFVINAAQGEVPAWLQALSECRGSWRALCMKANNSSVASCEDSSLSLKASQKTTHKGAPRSGSDRALFEENKGSLLDLRNMLFLRICNILIMLCRPWEMAQRALPYIQNAQLELKALNAELSCAGAVDAWALAGFLETLLVSERYNDSTQVGSYSLHTAQLWAHARHKMKALGVVCGLMPRDPSPSSAQIHLVVNILAGLGDDPRSGEAELSPCRRISEALSSKESFMRHYKDVCEIAMGTFKHVGRLRSARLIGKDLAEFYLDKGEPQMAVQFLQDLLKMYVTERWNTLAVMTQKQLLECYRLLSYDALYLHTDFLLAANSFLDQEERKYFFSDALLTKERLEVATISKNFTFPFSGIFSLEEVQIVSDSTILTLNSDVRLRITVTSSLLSEIKIRRVSVACGRLEEAESTRQFTPRKASVTPSLACRLAQPKMQIQHVSQTQSVLVVCSNQHQVLSRRDSSNLGCPSLQDIARVKSDTQFVAKSVHLAPGKNTIELNFCGNQCGSYELRQLAFDWDQLGFIDELGNTSHCIRLDIIQERSKITFEIPKQDLMAGVDQVITLSVSAGSQSIEAGSKLFLSSPSRELQFLRSSSGANVFELGEDSIIEVGGEIGSFESRSFLVTLRSPFHDQLTYKGVIHEVIARGSWRHDQDIKSFSADQERTAVLEHEPSSTEPAINEESDYRLKACSVSSTIKLRFLPPFIVTNRLLTCDTAKFLHVTVAGYSSQEFIVSAPSLKCPAGLRATMPSEVSSYKITADYPTSYLWQLDMADNIDLPVELNFSLNYEWIKHDQSGTYNAVFKLNSFKTLYAIHACVEPESQQGHCKVDAPCKLNIRVVRLIQQDDDHTGGENKISGKLYIEVIADPSFWAILGRNSDIFTLTGDEFTFTIELKPLLRGYLPIPQVRLMKYHPPSKGDDTKGPDSARLEPFLPGQIYNWSRAAQAHVPTAAHPETK